MKCKVEKEFVYIDANKAQKIVKSGRILTLIKNIEDKCVLRFGNKMFVVEENFVQIA